MLPFRHRPIAFLCALALIVATSGIPSARAATAIATFASPVPGLITISHQSSYNVSWTLADGVVVSSASVTVQTSRPIGITGCDLRWVPVRSSPITGTSYLADGLLPNRCYRLLLNLTTDSGQSTVVSPIFILATAALGPTAEFTHPYVDGVVAYEATQNVGWADWDTFGKSITLRQLFEQTAPAVSGSCGGVTWSGWTQLSPTGTAITRSVQPSYCYRYLVILYDAAGFRSETVSGAMSIAAGLPAWLGTLNFYRSSAFATQATNTWCVAASSQMQLNIILGQSDQSSSRQSTYITYGQANDGGNYPAGTNPAGWSAIMNRYGGSSYSVQRFADSTSALKRAATRMRQSNKPVGMLVWGGRHAWVIHGFTASADPATTTDFTVTGVYISGPLYPRTPNSSGYDPAPNTLYTPAQLAKYFTVYSDTIVKTWNGGYVLIVP